jgi:hypothetical protein
LSKIEVEIVNWEKFNTRRDIKATHWFRLENSFVDDPDFYHFTFEERFVWIMILSLASRKSKAKISINLQYAERCCGLSIDGVFSALEKLKECGCITHNVTQATRARDVDVTPTYANDTLQTNKQTIQTEQTGQTYSGKKSKKPKASPESLRSRAKLKEFWLERFSQRFGHPYAGADSAFFNTTLKKIHESLGDRKTAEAMRDYLAWNDPFIAKKGHPLHLLLQNLHSLEAQKHRPEKTMSIVAKGRATEKVLTESEQRLEEMKAYARRDNPGFLQEPELVDSRASEPNGRILPLDATRRIPETRGELHGAELETDAEASDDSA